EVEIYRRQVQEGRAHWISAGRVWTRSNGEFRFTELAAGTYKLFTHELLDRDPLTFNPRGQLYGYPPVYFPAANDFASGSTISLSPGRIFHADLTPVRRAYYPVKVRLSNLAAGTPIGVEVSLHGHRGPGYSLGYNERTGTIEGMLPDGTYSVQAVSFGTNGATGLLNLTVKGAAVQEPTMTLLPNGSISVNVKEQFTSDNNPETNGLGGGDGIRQNRGRYTNVRLEPAEDFGIERGPRNPSAREDDSIVLDDVQPGRYWVRVDSSRGFLASITSGGVDLLHHTLVVGLGASPPPIELTMRDDGAQIDGTVEGVATALLGAGVSTGTLTASLDLDKRITMSAVRLLKVLAGLVLLARIVSPGLCSAQSGSREGAPVNGSFRIAGTVVSASSGAPLGQALVSIVNTKDPRDAHSMVTSEDGHFEFKQLKAGKYSLKGARRGFVTGFYNQHEQFSTAIVTGVGVDTENLVLRFSPSAVLSGKVIDEWGEPVRHANVTLYRNDPSAGESRIA